MLGVRWSGVARWLVELGRREEAFGVVLRLLVDPSLVGQKRPAITSTNQHAHAIAFSFIAAHNRSVEIHKIA